jgi:hypothetical protein
METSRAKYSVDQTGILTGPDMHLLPSRAGAFAGSILQMIFLRAELTF